MPSLRALALIAAGLILWQEQTMVQGTALSASLVEVDTVPETPVIELTRAGQALNFDFRVRNGGESPFLLSQLTLVVHGREGQPTFNEIARDPAALMGNHGANVPPLVPRRTLLTQRHRSPAPRGL